MRIVGGRHRGRVLETPIDQTTRPTADRVRQALFDRLVHGPGVEGRRVLDAFAGTGALGLEALSRGAAAACFLEADSRALALIKRNVDALSEQANARIERADATRPPVAREPYDLAFLDPPYGKGMATSAIAALDATGWLTEDCVIVVEMATKTPELTPKGFSVTDTRAYGSTRVELWQRTA